jgi:hypothetical protein
MKPLLVLIAGLLAVGCGKTEPMGSGNEYNPELAIDQNTPKAEPVKELTPEEKKALRDSVVGEYEFKPEYNREDKNIITVTRKYVLLENGVRKWYLRMLQDDFKEIEEEESKWSIVDGEIHIDPNSRLIAIWRINADKSITSIATILDGKRTEWSKEEQTTYKKIK